MKLTLFVVLGAFVGCGVLVTTLWKTSSTTETTPVEVLFEEVEIEEPLHLEPQFDVIDIESQKMPDMKRCYRKNKKPVTMEDEAMHRAKVFHRGLPIEGCAPLSPEEHKARFDEAKKALEEKSKKNTDSVLTK